MSSEEAARRARLVEAREAREAGQPVVEHPLIPAATVVLLRDGDDGLETLMLRRNSKLEFAGGMWVFPGGRIDPADHVDPRAAASGPDGVPTDDPDGLLAAARRAAVREAGEEAGLELHVDELVWLSHWTPPGITPKRFATWFFVAPAPAGTIRVDGGEIHAHAWMSPTDAHRRRDALEIELAPPTWITLAALAAHDTVDAALTDIAARGPEYFATRFALRDDGIIALYHGDAGYEDSDPDLAGGRHRLWMMSDGWRYERDV